MELVLCICFTVKLVKKIINTPLPKKKLFKVSGNGAMGIEQMIRIATKTLVF